MKMNKLLLFFFMLILINYKTLSQSTWEYYNKGNEQYEIIGNIEENNEGNIITTTVIVDYNNENLNKSVIKLHNGNTGEVIIEKTYKIDSLATAMSWIFYNNESETYTIVGEAHRREQDYRRGFFFLTHWDSELNLLKDTIFRIEPITENNYLWFINGTYAENGDFLVIGNVKDRWEENTTNRKRIFLRIDKKGNIIKYKWHQRKPTDGNQATLVEYKDNNYISHGGESYILNDNFEIIDSITTWKSIDHIPDFNYTARRFSENKYLIYSRFSSNAKRGLAFFDDEVELLNSLIISKPSISFESSLINRDFDYIDTSNIYVSSRHRYFDYYTIAKVNSELEPYWIKYYSEGDTLGQYLSSIKATSDGGCILTGASGPRHGDFIIINDYGSWMKKFDSDGNTVSTLDPNNNTWSITVFPNPSPGEFKIDIDGVSNRTKLKLFDIQGREVKNYGNLTQGTNNLNMYDVSSGMYIWNLEKEGKVIGTGKWVKE